jgi:hypothetical protein
MAEHIIVHVNGTLQTVIIGENPAHLFVRAHFTYGSDWSIVAGAEQVSHAPRSTWRTSTS